MKIMVSAQPEAIKLTGLAKSGIIHEHQKNMPWMHNITRETSQYDVIIAVNKLQYDHDEGLLDVVMRMGFYGAIIAIFLMIVALVVKLLWDYGEAGEQHTRANENSRLLLSTEEILFSFYGSSSEEDLESGKTSCSSSSSDDLYDGKICAICYDDHRSCMFVPCGHCVTCYTCAKRIVNDEIKTCPICRTIIHKVRRLQIL